MNLNNNKSKIKILISKKTGKTYYSDILKDFHCKEGFIKKEDLSSNERIIYSNINREFLMFEASNYDYALKIKRGPQIILPKDLGYIISRTRVNKEFKIVEAGGGSGGATSFFAGIAKKVHTYEIIKENYELIKKNLEYLKIKNVKLTKGDLTEHIEKEKDIDLLFLDMPDPKIILEKNLSGIKNGHYIVCYLPSISQISDLVNFIESVEYLYFEEISEIILRHWKINSRISRPEHRKEIDHTAFLVFIRKI